MQRELLDAHKVAKMLQVSYRKVVDLTEAGELPGFRIGNQWRYREESIEEYLANKEREQQSKKHDRR